MFKRCLAIGMVIAVAAVCVSSFAAEPITGEWRGSASASSLPFSLSATVIFYEDNTFYLSLNAFLGIVGLEARGNYSVTGSAIAVRPTRFDGSLASYLYAPDRIGTVSLPYTLSDGRLVIEGNRMGLNGKITLRRK